LGAVTTPQGASRKEDWLRRSCDPRDRYDPVNITNSTEGVRPRADTKLVGHACPCVAIHRLPPAAADKNVAYK
jgi:hypothetical protein